MVIWQQNLLHFGADEVPFEIPFEKCLRSLRTVFCFAAEIHPVLQLQFLLPPGVILSCFESRSLQIAMEWLRPCRFLAPAAACVLLLSFAAERRKFYSTIFSILALMIFLLKFLLKSGSESFFIALPSRSGFAAAVSFAPPPRSSNVLCNSVSADRTGMAASRFLAPAAACVLLLSSMLSVVDCIGVAASRLWWWFGGIFSFGRWWLSFWFCL